jgi:hypothetical protein
MCDRNFEILSTGKKGWEIIGYRTCKRRRNVLRLLTETREFSLEIDHTPSRAHTASYSVGTGDIFSGD